MYQSTVYAGCTHLAEDVLTRQIIKLIEVVQDFMVSQPSPRCTILFIFFVRYRCCSHLFVMLFSSVELRLLLRQSLTGLKREHKTQ